MKFWNSSEATEDANTALRAIDRNIERCVNALLPEAKLEERWSDWKWAFVAIINNPVFEADFPERVRQNKKDRVIEFRLKIDHDDFLDASPLGRITLYLEQLHRSVDLMGKWKMTNEDRGQLHQVLDNVQKNLTRQVHS